jgi:protein-tyrosine phosphatase
VAVGRVVGPAFFVASASRRPPGDGRAGVHQVIDKPGDLQVIHESPQEVVKDRRGLIRLLNPFGRIWLRVVARLLEWTTDLIPSRLNFSWITEQLAVGGAPRRRDYRQLAARGITAVIDAREEASDDAEALAQFGIELLYLPTPDRHSLSSEQLVEGTRWALERVERGGKVFVHCQHGVGRGPLQGCAILIGQGLSAPEALKTLRARRWQAAPNDRQIEGLLIFEERWKQAQAEQPEASGAA